MKNDRRDFLRHAAALPFLYGLEEVLGQEPVTQAPDWYEKALKRMKESGRCGIVLVVPDLAAVKPRPIPDIKVKPEKEERFRKLMEEEAERAAKIEADLPRRRMGTALWVLANEDHPAAHELFCEAVVLCMTSELADWSLRRAGDPRNRFLLDSDGTRLEADTVAPEILENPQKLAESLRRLLHGEGNARLREKAESIDKTLDPQLRKAVSNLSSDSAEEREAATALLARHAESIAPYLVHLGLTAGDAELRGRAGDVLRKYYATTKEDVTGPRLPFGCTMPKFGDECGRLVPESESRMACGMGIVRTRQRKFVRFLLK